MEDNIATILNPLITPSAHKPGPSNLFIPVNSLYSIAKTTLLYAKMDIMEGKGNQHICDSRVIWKITKDLYL